MFGVIRNLYRGAVREPMIRKRGHQYYKGTGTGSHGRHNGKGGYIIESQKVRHYVVPNLENCELTPYVSHRSPKVYKTCTQKDFLEAAKEE
ncbi:hypothetical protein CONCODRAFT_5757 [Conidiobolus coronatus NRRL 28638]|uniref:Uncharacterized protein n=1 Tax=Conidiobolus coronatus (strain ATCC 28846 / CBS 209.66 / NRRL 28638) TaxID=796925 RepID=A0A137P928_CONC2|nr:hypothetical protein CONCODRAFT_5757 [Conidiobolus coronatus NRRL 28638]|eukprot:KXN71505.1 hypothetical protein CONCODRAFT_5757 [Conidiobolus coronatus NRRL 28638]